MANAMQSWSDSSLLYDSLKHLNREKEFKSIYGKCNGFMFWWRAGWALIWWITYAILPILPFILDIILQSIYIVISLFLNDKFISRIKHIKTWILKSFKNSYIEAFTREQFAKIFIFSALIWCIAKVTLIQYTQPYLQFINIDIIWFGIIFAFFNIISGFGSMYANKLWRMFSIDKYLILHASIFWILLSFLSDFSFIWIALTIFTILFFLMGLYVPTVSTYINEKVSSHNRTTMLSINNQIYSIGAIILLVITWYLSDINSVLSAINALSVISFILLILYIISVRHVKVD